MQIALSPELSARLRAAALERDWTHWVNCGFYDETEGPCTCGIPDLLGDLLMLLGPAVEAAVTQAQRAA